MSEIKVSIIVPVYGVEKYIGKCLESLVNQTLKDIEIIVVNDGSLDNSQTVIDEYVKKYPDIVKSYIKENGGQGSARNYGIEKAKGNYLGFVDGDDFIEHDMYEKMYNLITEENYDIVACDFIDYKSGYEKYIKCTDFKNKYDYAHSVCNKLFKKEMFNNVRFLNKIWYEDLNVMGKIIANTNNIGFISEGLYHCLIREGSTMNNNNAVKNLDIITVIEDIRDYYKKNNLDEDNEISSYLIFDHILITSIDRVNMQDNKEKEEIITKLRTYCHETISNYRKMKFYNNIPKKRKLIAFFNFYRMHDLSKKLLNIKKKMR